MIIFFLVFDTCRIHVRFVLFTVKSQIQTVKNIYSRFYSQIDKICLHSMKNGTYFFSQGGDRKKDVCDFHTAQRINSVSEEFASDREVCNAEFYTTKYKKRQCSMSETNNYVYFLFQSKKTAQIHVPTLSDILI